MDQQKPLTVLMTGATAAIVAISSCAFYLIDLGAWASHGRYWPMILSSSAATLLVMSFLYSDLQRLYRLLTEREARANREARVDPLTGLANRKALLEQLDVARAESSERKLLLLILDLNHFKRINDTRGHMGGDELLVAMARRLEEGVPEAIIARLGGDEFAVALDAGDQREAEDVCRRIVEVWAKPFDLSQGECFVSGSVGAAFLEPNLTTSELLRRADAAMYAAKTQLARFKVFDHEMIEKNDRRSRLSVDLRNCSPSFEGCRAVYQPIVSRDGSPIALEVLLRWKHPMLGEIPPPEIVSVAEEVQLVNELSLFVAKQACRAAQVFPNAVIAFNVNAVQLFDGRFEEQLLQLLSEEGVAPTRVQIEVKEADFAARSRDMSGTSPAAGTGRFSDCGGRLRLEHHFPRPASTTQRHGAEAGSESA